MGVSQNKDYEILGWPLSFVPTCGDSKMSCRKGFPLGRIGTATPERMVLKTGAGQHGTWHHIGKKSYSNVKKNRGNHNHSVRLHDHDCKASGANNTATYNLLQLTKVLIY